MKRTNVFIVEDNSKLRELAENCARLYNKLNYQRRQGYIRYRKFEWYPKHLYEKYSPLIGSATAQQIIIKNNEAWKSFLALKRLEHRGKLPPHITKVSMPRYWKNNGRRELRVFFRNDCYRIAGDSLVLPKGLKLRIKGVLKWHGKQGRLEIAYDDVDGIWRGFMAVEVEKPPIRGGSKPLYIDLGVRCLATLWARGWKQAIAFSGNQILHDWWYWTKRIAKTQSRLAEVNRARTSRSIRRLYRMRQRRFRHAVNAMIKTIIEKAAKEGFAEVIIGYLKGIRNGDNKCGKANAMINNFWSFDYMMRRLKEKAEECGMRIKEVSERQTSSTCPRCKSREYRRRKRLFKCVKCGLEAHRDTVGVLNIAYLHEEDEAIGVMAHPLLLRWNGMKWEPKRAMNIRPMRTSEARISRLQSRRVSTRSYSLYLI